MVSETQLILLVYTLTSPLWGFAAFLVLARSYGWQYLRTFGDRLAFFFAPYPPRNMVVVQKMGGEEEVYYDAEIEKHEKGYKIALPGVVIAAPKIFPKLLEILATGVVPGKPSPYGVGWRVVLGWSVAWLTSYYIALWSYSIYDWNTFTVTLFMASIMILVYLAGVILYRLRTPNVQFIGLMITGAEMPVYHAVPVCGPLGAPPTECLRIIKDAKLEWHVPEELKSIFEQWLKRFKNDASKTAAFFERAMEPEIYRRALSECLASMQSMRQAARSYIRLTFMRLTVPRILLLLLVFAVGLAVGYALSGGGVAVVPAGGNETLVVVQGG